MYSTNEGLLNACDKYTLSKQSLLGNKGTNSEVAKPIPLGTTTLLRYGRNFEYKTLSVLKTIVELPSTNKMFKERIKVALGFGDLSENSEYDEAKNNHIQI